MTTSYGERLTAVIKDRGALCVGIDPHPALLDRWGLPRDAAGLERFARGTVEALGETVAVFKPQSAFYEAYGSAGIAVLELLLADIAAAGAISLLDVKRGDIGSTMDAYAAAYLAEGSTLAADAITITPYVGVETLAGTADLAVRNGRGVYVLALTSNPEAPAQQLARTAAGTTVAETVIGWAADRNAGAEPLGSVGLVVGATIDPPGFDFAKLNGSILAPGVGAQGGEPEHLPAIFGPATDLVLPSASREVLSAGPDPEALREVATSLVGRVNSVRSLL
ncbi:orotidine-5'-phosphate decarboxylase [Microlunatus speluncae]|uniref:orotidine-5'-phosphate decarboxylase n=1 Tax=Microlunatus speluncae TaxID=2594267 RepID=UPI0012661C65|nr:orotidine-5'-phosphate decarboxylase [Microlunatus speluncae]